MELTLIPVCSWRKSPHWAPGVSLLQAPARLSSMATVPQSTAWPIPPLGRGTSQTGNVCETGGRAALKVCYPKKKKNSPALLLDGNRLPWRACCCAPPVHLSLTSSPPVAVTTPKRSAPLRSGQPRRASQLRWRRCPHSHCRSGQTHRDALVLELKKPTHPEKKKSRPCSWRWNAGAAFVGRGRAGGFDRLLPDSAWRVLYCERSTLTSAAETTMTGTERERL